MKLYIFIIGSHATKDRAERYSSPTAYLFYEDALGYYFWFNSARDSLNKPDGASPVEVMFKNLAPHKDTGYCWINASPKLWAAVCAKVLETSL